MVPGPLIGGWLATEYGKPIIIDGVAGTVPTLIIFQAAAIIILLAIIPMLMAKEIKKEVITNKMK